MKITETNKADIMKDVRRIVSESLSGRKSEYDGTTIFNIEPYMYRLLDEAARKPELMVVINRYEDARKSGVNDIFLFEQFGRDLEKFAFGNANLKAIIEEMNETLRDNADVLDVLKNIYSLQDSMPDQFEGLLFTYNAYLNDPTEENLDYFMEEVDALDEYEDYSALAVHLREVVLGAERVVADAFVPENVYESKEAIAAKQIEKNRLERKENDIMRKVERYLTEREMESELKQQRYNQKYSLDGIANKNGLKLFDRINEVLKSDASRNTSLKNILLKYTSALAQGAFEERLYETLLINTSKYDYLLPVDRMINAINEVVSKNEEKITLTKILEEMRDSSSSYIYVELIQEDVARYVHEPNDVNRIQLRNALMPYAADPYINKMFGVIYLDEERRSGSDLERRALNIKEQIEIIRQNATLENIYTPVQYVKEGESIFNVHGQYFVKKGNSIAVLEKKYIPQLDKRFVELCHLVNDPHVQIYEDRIILNGSENSATIYEGYVDINGYREDRESLRRLNEMCMKYENYDTNFYIMCSCLLENFNNIAKIEWAKRIVLNENNDISADLFKLNENIFVNCHNAALSKHTFYRNINPIYCKNILNEHMGINVSSLFEDMLPNQDKIILRLNETKNEYEKSIEQYEKAIEDLKNAKEEADDESVISELNDAIEDTESKLKEVKDEYKEWQKTAEETTGEKVSDGDDNDVDGSEEATPDPENPDDPNVTHEEGTGPISADEVDDHRDELSTPLDAEGVQNNNGSELSDEDFDSILAGNETDDVDADEDIIDTEAIDREMVNPTGGEEELTQVDFNEVPDAEEADDEDIFIDEPAEDELDNDEYEQPEPETDDVIVVGDDYDEIGDNDDDITTIEGDEEGIPATDIFGGDVENPLGGTVGVADEEINNFYNPNIQTDEFSIVNVMFRQNIVDGTIWKSGTVTVVRPIIDNNGQKTTATNEIGFYLDKYNKPKVYIENGGNMSASLYNAIVKSVLSHPAYEMVVNSGLADPDAAESEDDKSWENEYNTEMNDEDRGIYTIGDDTDEDVVDTDDIDDDIFVDVTSDEKDTETDGVDDNLFGNIFADKEDEEDYDIDTDVIDGIAPTQAPVVAKPVVNPSKEVIAAVAEPVAEPDTIAEPAPKVDGLGDVAEEDDEYEDFADLFGNIGDDEDDEVVEDPVRTYTKDGTEYEFPADDVVDDTVIPESKQANKKSQRLNENRSKIVKMKKK